MAEDWTAEGREEVLRDNFGRSRHEVHAYRDASEECEPSKKENGKRNPKYQQSDHILQNACFVDTRTAPNGIDTCQDYYYKDAPCVCLEDATNTKTEHGRKTQAQNEWAADQRDLGTNPTYEEVREANLEAMKKAKPELQNAPGEVRASRRLSACAWYAMPIFSR